MQLGFLPIAQQLGHKYALTVDGNTASTRLAMVLATEQVPFLHSAAPLCSAILRSCAWCTTTEGCRAVPCHTVDGDRFGALSCFVPGNAEDGAAPLQVTLKHVSHYWMFYEAALKPWVHYVPVGQYDARDILPVHFLCNHPALPVLQ